MNSNQKNAVMGGLALVVLGIAGYLFFRPTETVTFPSTKRIDGVCLACKAEQNTTADLTSPPPFVCDSCGSSAVFSWMYCNACKKRFIPHITMQDGVPKLPVIPACTGCGSTNTTQYATDDPDQAPVGDVALPKWPPQ